MYTYISNLYFCYFLKLDVVFREDIAKEPRLCTKPSFLEFVACFSGFTGNGAKLGGSGLGFTPRWGVRIT